MLWSQNTKNVCFCPGLTVCNGILSIKEMVSRSNILNLSTLLSLHHSEAVPASQL